jgi:hypothetical protein
MFGRNPKLPFDIAFGLAKTRNRNPQTKYIQNLRSRLVEAHKTAAEQIKKSQKKYKSRCELKTRGAVIQKGDGKHKLVNKWEDDIYIVTDQPNENIPVYMVIKENGLGRVRSLHKDFLFHIGCIQNEKKLKIQHQRTLNLNPLSDVSFSLKKAILFPLDLSVNILLGTAPVAFPFISKHVGTALITWSIYAQHFSTVIWVLQNRMIQSWSSSFVRGVSRATHLLSSFHTIAMGFTSGLSI